MTKEKEQLCFNDVEQLLGALAQEDAQTELMRGAARAEIRRVFRRRRCLRVAGEVGVLALLCGSASLLLPNARTEAPLAQDIAEAKAKQPHGPAVAAAPIMRSRKAASKASCDAAEPFDCHTETCEVVIYSVPL